MHNNILLIGNGFDRAHRLPTTYKNFLKFVKKYRRQGRGALPYWEFLSPFEQAAYREYYTKKPQMYTVMNNTLPVDCEPLLEFFENSPDGDWVDFEREIQGLVTSIWTRDNILNRPIPAKYGISSREAALDLLELHIEDLLYLMDLYFGLMIPHERVSKPPAYLYTEGFNKVISFNYTDTYRKVLLERFGISLPEDSFHAIHGRTSHENSSLPLVVEPHNMVLGFTEKEFREQPPLLYFQKFFQRIRNKTGITYRGWVGLDPVKICETSSDTLTIFGHSCDVTDGDVLQYLIDRVRWTKIYYLNDEDYNTKVRNLLRIFGSDRFEEYYYFGRIDFKKIPSAD